MVDDFFVEELSLRGNGEFEEYKRKVAYKKDSL